MKQQLILLAIVVCVPALGLVSSHLIMMPGALWTLGVVTGVQIALACAAHALAKIFNAEIGRAEDGREP